MIIIEQWKNGTAVGLGSSEGLGRGIDTRNKVWAIGKSVHGVQM